IGSGSGQQSITAFAEADDSNSFWLIQAGAGKRCKRGEPVPCGSIVRLRHANTKAYLHSHLHSSPLSRQQEVSCYDGEDTGDDWKVECPSGKYWTREEPIQLSHMDSKTYLTSSTSHQYGQPIPGQLEVAAAKTSSKSTHWIAQVRRVFFGLGRKPHGRNLHKSCFYFWFKNVGGHLFCRKYTVEGSKKKYKIDFSKERRMWTSCV
ncbi:MIR motif-containing protein, partial [Zychaea mexicana]|uniref:MIR motif-containing protein n=1 Tax=Zychaea mexicana TaxID=64656 RepID=UPI0022FE8E64